MNHSDKNIVSFYFFFLLLSYSSSLLACDKYACFGSEPSGEWVTIGVQSSYSCGNTTAPNQSCVDYVGNHSVGSQVTVCQRSNIPGDWDRVRYTSSASCGTSSGNAVVIVRTSIGLTRKLQKKK